MIHFEAISLGLMGSDDRKESIFLQESFGKLVSKEIRTSSGVIFFSDSFKFAVIVINRISPHEITKRSTFGNLLESINFFNIVNLELVK